MKYEFLSNDREETITHAYSIGTKLIPGDVILLTGDLGAGKTTFTKGIGKAIGVTKVINSPTFTIVKEYKGNMPLYHLDLYRLDGVGEDFDLEEYIFGQGVSVIEWPYQAEGLLPNEYLMINIKYLDENRRQFTIEEVGSRYEGRLKDVNFNN